jgi:hypothetical protein
MVTQNLALFFCRKEVSVFDSHLVASSFGWSFHKFLLSLPASIVGILK